MAQPFVRRNNQAEEVLGARPLTDICVDALIRYSKFLGDVGWIETRHLRKICPHLTRAELESIEDMTLEGSARDLSWYTWHCWLRIYKSLYGQPQPVELLPLPGEPPADYEPPKVDYAPADYHGMILVREQAEEDRKAAAVSRLRAGYTTENHKRLVHGVEYTTKLPPPKRSRLNSPGSVIQQQLAAYNANKTLGGRPAVKVMKDLGLAGKSGSSRSGSSSSSRQSIYNWTGKSAAAQQTSQPSALACLAKKKVAAQPASRPVGRTSRTQQQRSGLQEAHRSQSGSVAARQPAARPTSAAVQLHPHSEGARQGSNTGSRLLDTPMSLGKASAGIRRS